MFPLTIFVFYGIPTLQGITSLLQTEVAGDGVDHWEVDRTKLMYIERLGSGQFGTVDKMATTLFTDDRSLDFVAVKTLKMVQASLSSGGHSYSGYASSALAEVATANSALVEETSMELVKIEHDFMKEISTMKELRHPNLVSLLGVCQQQNRI
jgi:serine/threonine protein kinase